MTNVVHFTVARNMDMTLSSKESRHKWETEYVNAFITPVFQVSCAFILIFIGDCSGHVINYVKQPSLVTW